MATKRVEGNTKQLVSEIGRDLCRVQGKEGEYRGYRKDILTEKLTHREIALLVCKRCKGILREACISTSGEQFCECCRNHEELYISYRSYEQTSPNTHVRDTVLSLKCSCPLQKRGCEWLGTLGECENHLDVCRHVYEKCKLECKIVLSRHELKIHVSEKCNFRQISCEHCKKDFRVCDMSNHLKKCPKIRMTCEQKCGTVMCREDMAQHLKKDCGRVVEKCKLGCGIELPRDELDIHVNTMCVQRKIPCKHCQKDFKACAMPNHLEECPKIRLTCELECGTVAYREDMAQHLEEECVEKKVECPFIKYKCEVGLIKRKKLNQHLKEKRTEHTELKLSAMEEIVMQQSEMINKQNETIERQLAALFSITNSSKLEWRIEKVVDGRSSSYYNYFSYRFQNGQQQEFQVDEFNFTLRVSKYGSISIRYPRQELYKVKVKFIFRIFSPSVPNVTWESKSGIIEIKQKGGSSEDIADIPILKEEFIRDDGVDLEIFVILL
ncbi:TNF receptor-associated factor 4 [Oopsacas minuta]|uniref:TNF receptor-associated factor 4 n=1 Tax=Oopsacas minuta TaxID=111878 RepID=A0AAV7JDF5_9METZ|nr:TNF receptor-associated factor 4 [Oopsacas minuta]